MADKRKGKKRKEELNALEEEDKPSKDEYKVAKWMRKNVPAKKTKFMGFNVEYFTGSKAVDALLVSPFAESMFSTREHVVDYLDKMLRHKFYHRALKVPISKEELEQIKKRKKKGDKDKCETSKTKEAESEKESKERDDAESSHAEGRSDDPSASPKPTKGQKKKKIRLEMHMKQYFEDGLDAYVWIYDPVPLHYWIFGSAVVLGAVAVCLFPLWPPEVRKGVYYLSIAGAGFLCLIIALAILRLVVFCILWLLTVGRHHLWLLPNLTEDVGFFASFWPLYHYEYKAPVKGGKSKKKKKEKDSDNEQEDDKVDARDGGGDESAEGDEDAQQYNDPEHDKDEEGNDGEGRSESESESSSQKSQTGKDFEMVDKNDVEIS